jgi:hypothetical protein
MSKIKIEMHSHLFRSTRENYGNGAVGYVEIKSEASKCVVRERICPE